MRQLTLNLPFGSVVFIFPLVVLFQCTISELAIYHLRWYARVQGSSVKSHSRLALLGTLATKAPCFVDFTSIKRYSIVLFSLTGVGAPIYSSIAQSVERMTVKGLPCSYVMARSQTSILIEWYSHGLTPNTASGMHESLIRAQFGEPYITIKDPNGIGKTIDTVGELLSTITFAE